MIDPKEYEDLVYSIYAQVEGQLYDAVHWGTDHLEFKNDEEIHEVHCYVMAGVTDLLKYGENKQKESTWNGRLS